MAYQLRRKITKAHKSWFTKALLVVLGLVSVFAISPFITAIRTDAAPTEYRTIDGSDNNVANPNYGKTGTQLIRLADPAYEDGISSPAGSNRPNPRTISNVVAAQDDPENRPNITDTTNMVFQWGQFLDHDIDLTEGKDESFPIIVPEGDEFFESGSEIPLERSIFDKTTGIDNPRQQINEITAWIDASNVYGSDKKRAKFLREGKCGRLKTSKKFNLLPLNTKGLPNSPNTDREFAIAGDIRASEQVGLLAIHTLFMREHNRLADIITRNTKIKANEVGDSAFKV